MNVVRQPFSYRIDQTAIMEEHLNRKSTLKEIALLFFKLGALSFGGPAVHIAMMEEEVVRKRKWMSHEHFLDLVGATNLIPGPNSTEMTMHCGNERAGWRGLVVAGSAFIFPAVVITLVFAWLYQQYGQLPQVEPFIYGIKPAVISLIVAAVYTLGKKAVKNFELALLGGGTLAASLMGMNEISALFACGGIGVLLHLLKKLKASNLMLSFAAVPLLLTPSITLTKIFLTFLKVGALLYGSGYVLFAFLDAELVATGLLSRQQLIDAIAVGQFTPGPVSSTATFVGYQLGGFSGALLATLGIFLPSFLLVALLNPLIPAMRRSTFLGAFLDSVNVASVAVILSVAIYMGRETLNDWRTMVIAAISVAIFLKWKINAVLIILGGAGLGYLLTLV